MQLVVRDHADGTHEVRALQRPPQVDPVTFENPAEGIHVPRLGTRSLLMLAVALAGHGYKLVDLDVRDSRMNLLPPDTEFEVTETAKARVRDGDVASAESALRGVRGGAYVVRIVLRAARGPLTFEIARDGIFVAHIFGASGPEEFIEDLSEVWQLGGVS
jgi:hypothetical protein